MEVWPGYITAIEEQEGGLMLMADVSHRVLHTATVLDKMYADVCCVYTMLGLLLGLGVRLWVKVLKYVAKYGSEV